MFLVVHVSAVVANVNTLQSFKSWISGTVGTAFAVGVACETNVVLVSSGVNDSGALVPSLLLAFACWLVDFDMLNYDMI